MILTGWRGVAGAKVERHEEGPIPRKWEREIVELHDFFEGWLSGELDRKAFGILERALAEDFVFVTTEGEVLGRDRVLDGIRSARGSRPDLSIRIEDVRTVSVCGGCRLALYEEWQETEEGRTGRVSTVLFRGRGRSAERVEWVHVHETWIEPPTERGR